MRTPSSSTAGTPPGPSASALVPPPTVGPIAQPHAGGPAGKPPLGDADSFRAWLVVLGSFCTQFTTFGFLSAFGFLSFTIGEVFDVDPTLVSLVGTVQLGCMFLGGSISTAMSEVYGTRAVLAVGSAIWVFGIFTASGANTYWELMLTLGVLCGLGTGSTYFTTLSVIPQWFMRGRGWAVSLSTMAGGLGQMVWALGGQNLLSTQGWRNTLRVIGGVGVFLLLIGIALVERRFPHSGKRRSVLAFNLNLLRTERSYFFFAFGVFFYMLVLFTPFALLPLNAQVEGITDPNFGSTTIALLGVGTAVGRFFSGAVSDRIGRARHIQINAFAASMCMWLWPTSNSEQTLLTFAFFYGLFTAAVFTAMPLVIANQFGPTNVGAVLSVVMLVILPAGTASAPIVASWYQDSGSFLGPQLYSGGMMLIACAAWCVMKDKPEGNFGKPPAAGGAKPPPQGDAKPPASFVGLGPAATSFSSDAQHRQPGHGEPQQQQQQAAAAGPEPPEQHGAAGAGTTTNEDALSPV